MNDTLAKMRKEEGVAIDKEIVQCNEIILCLFDALNDIISEQRSNDIATKIGIVTPK